LISLRFFKYAFWLAWVVNLVFAPLLVAMVVWLQFFWHW
jgi:hypothetical protein